MAMITVKGQFINMFQANSSTDRESGEIRPGAKKIQIIGKMPLESGESQMALRDFSCKEPDVFKAFQGKWIEFAIGMMATERGDVILYIPKGAKPIEIDQKTA